MRPSSSTSETDGRKRGGASGDVAALDEGAERSFVRSLERGLAVMRALNAPGPGLTLAEVARDTELPRAAARRFLLTLQQLGYVRARDRRFALTPRVLELGYAYLSALSLPEVAQPHLRDLAGSVHESCSMSVLDGTDVVYVAREPTRRIMTVAISIGTRFPAHATSMGRVLLSALPDDELRSRLERGELRSLTASTLADVDALMEEIARAREQGWALVDGELEDGLRSIAAPVRGPAGRVLAAVNVSAHASRTSVGELREAILPHLLDTVAAIERDAAAGGEP